MSFLTNSKLEEVHLPLLKTHGVRFSVKREDTLHTEISGNKWHKLKYNIDEMKRQGFDLAASFGGPFSNHLHALSFAGKELGFKTIGFVRGEVQQPLNPTLQDATNWGMQLIPVSREVYRQKNKLELIEKLIAPFSPCYVIPEGGANKLAVKGCSELAEIISQQALDIDVICAPCGTGATLAGLVSGASVKKILGFSALKNNHDLEGDINALLTECGTSEKQNWQLIHDYHFGGFAKITSELVVFMDEWLEQTGITLDPIYTAKMFYGICDMIKKGCFKKGEHIVALHTGGLQGLRGMQAKIERLRLTNGSQFV